MNDWIEIEITIWTRPHSYRGEVVHFLSGSALDERHLVLAQGLEHAKWDSGHIYPQLNSEAPHRETCAPISAVQEIIRLLDTMSFSFKKYSSPGFLGGTYFGLYASYLGQEFSTVWSNHFEDQVNEIRGIFRLVENLAKG